jgi:hypothetical protein
MDQLLGVYPITDPIYQDSFRNLLERDNCIPRLREQAQGIYSNRPVINVYTGDPREDEIASSQPISMLSFSSLFPNIDNLGFRLDLSIPAINWRMQTELRHSFLSLVDYDCSCRENVVMVANEVDPFSCSLVIKRLPGYSLGPEF